MIKVSESTKWHVKDQYLPWGMVETQFGGYDKAKAAMEQGRIVAIEIDGEEWYKVKTMEVTRGAEVRRERGLGTSGQVVDGDWLAKAQDWLSGLEFDIGKPLENQSPPAIKHGIEEPINSKDKDPMLVAMTKVKAAHTNLNNLKVKALEVSGLDAKDPHHADLIEKQVTNKIPEIQSLLNSYDYLLKNKVLQDHAGKTDVAAIRAKLMSDSKAMAPIASAVQVAMSMAGE
ncbi:unnamed protein product [Prorocentrum cordatum]|uniref:Uncharacterized protein n=1 Tax=Prorocentrum cordatum TaxID=2364126 RepID=A0ABN9XEE9_9DINO|nr:unnamed protein product [Polarella glacialis]